MLKIKSTVNLTTRQASSAFNNRATENNKFLNFTVDQCSLNNLYTLGNYKDNSRTALPLISLPCFMEAE